MSPTVDPSDAVRDVVAPLADDAGVDLVDVVVKGSGSRTHVRVAVDRKGGVDVATLQELSRTASRALDQADPIPGRYVLEVTSPGVDHPLRDRRAFDRVEGRDVAVERELEDGSTARVRGRVQAADEEAVELLVDGEVVRVPYGSIRAATQALPW